MTVEIAWAVSAAARSGLGLGDGEVTRACEAALQVGEREGLELSVVFVRDEALCELHERFLDDPTPTDVITFDLSDPGEGPAGELYVSIDAAHRRAAEFGMAVDNELLLYVVHGTLHLCGFDDHEPDERRAMRDAEVRALQLVGVKIDAARHAEL